MDLKHLSVKWPGATRLRSILGCMFLFSGFVKLLNPNPTALSLFFVGFPGELIPLILFSILSIEIVVGFGMLFLDDQVVFVKLAMVMLFIFTGYLVHLSRFTAPPHCNCYGLVQVFKNARVDAIFGIIRNLSFLAILY